MKELNPLLNPEFADLRNNFDALHRDLEGSCSLNEHQHDLLSELHIAFSDYEHYLAGQPELEDMLRDRDIEILRLHKIISDGFAEYLKLFQETNRLKQELKALKKITFE